MAKLLFLLLFLLIPLHGAAQNLDTYMKKQGLVDVMAADTTLRLHLYYATSANFMGKAVYKGITRAWLHPKAAAMLIKASLLLRKEHPHWHLLIYDAARPMSVQKTMWILVRGTKNINYISNPNHSGGLHNYGMAVDITIINEHGFPLPMGTPFDFFGPKAHINNEAFLLKSEQLTSEEYNNRLLLRRIMKKAGFHTIAYEWWHFNACSRSEARMKYPMIP